MCRTSIYEARNNFSALVKCAEEGEVVELTRYDKPVAVIMSYEEYEQMDNEKPNLLDKLQTLKKEYADVVDDIGFDILIYIDYAENYDESNLIGYDENY